MTDEVKETPRERLEFEISNAAPLIGSINGQLVKIERIKLSKIRDAWIEVINIFQAYQVLASQAIRSDGGGARKGTSASDGEPTEAEPAEAERIGADIFLEQLKELGPDVVNILHKFLQTASNIDDETLNGLDFWSLIEFTITVLEHNVGPELRSFFRRGGSALRSLGFLSGEPDSSGTKSSATTDGEQKTSPISDPAN